MEEKIKAIEEKIEVAKTEEEYKYLVKIKNLTINMAAYSQLFVNTGNPPPLPPYGGG